MPIPVLTQVTGSQLGELLRDEPEETWYALCELAKAEEGFHDDVASYAYADDNGAVVIFLRDLANAIEETMP